MRKEKPTKKRKTVETEAEQRDQALAAVYDEDDNNEERGAFGTDLKQPVLSPVVDQGVPAQTRAEERRE